VTTFIIFLSVANIALGYGLAIYLGHARVAIRTAVSESSFDEAVETTEQLPTEVAEVASFPEQEVLESLEEMAGDIQERTQPAAAAAEPSTRVGTNPEPSDDQETAESEAAPEKEIVQG
jgi:hypothetical protein